MRTVYPALTLLIKDSDGWSRFEHRIHKYKGWFSAMKAPIYIGFDKGYKASPRGKYEKWVFEQFSFIEDIVGSLPSISVDDRQILSKEEITEEEFRSIR